MRERRAVGIGATLGTLFAWSIVSASPSGASLYTTTEIANSVSRLRVDVMWASKARNEGVFLWPNNLSSSQEFKLLKTDSEYFRIQAQHSKQCLIVAGDSRDNGARVVQYPACGAYNARAEWRKVWRSGHLLLVNKWSGRCLDADNGAGGAPPEQSVLQVWDCVGKVTDWNIANQSWEFLPPRA